jgi:ketosteroid isomerase-like protein
MRRCMGSVMLVPSGLPLAMPGPNRPAASPRTALVAEIRTMKTHSRVGFPALSFAFLAIVLLSACAREDTALVFGGDVAADWERAYNAGDVDGIAALLTEDAVVMPPNAPIVEGRSAIKSWYREHFTNRVVPAKTDERELIVFGDMTYRQGVYALDLPDGTTEYGKFVELWKNDNGQWRLHRSIWSSNEPTAAQASEHASTAGTSTSSGTN